MARAKTSWCLAAAWLAVATLASPAVPAAPADPSPAPAAAPEPAASSAPAAAAPAPAVAVPAPPAAPAAAQAGAPASLPPRMAPGVRWVVPPEWVALECPGLKVDVKGLAALGASLDELGIEVRRAAAGAAGEGLAAVVRCGAGDDLTRVPPVVGIPADPRSDEGLAAAARVEASLGPASRPFPRPLRILFLADPGSDVGRALLVQSSWVAAYARLDADFLDLPGHPRLPARWLAGYDAVVLASDRLPRGAEDRLSRILDAYVKAGGGLAAVGGVEDEELLPVLGVRKVEGEAVVRTWTCDESFLPGVTGLDPTVPPEDADTLPRLQPAPGARVPCRAGQPGRLDVPLAIAATRGAGATITWAGSGLADKSSRGLILLSLMEVVPAAAALLDAHVFWNDDCPLPMTGLKRPPLDTLYDITDEAFYRDRWWPGMRQAWERHGVRPSFAFILTYDDRMPGQGVPDGYPEGSAALGLARAIRDAGHEVDLHGYNHQSLSVGRNEWTVGWAGRGQMLEALTQLRGEFQRIFGPGAAPSVYVAPSNFVQKMGKEALRAVFPEIRALASQYLDEGPIQGQEFGPDPDVPGLVNLPRISSEHFLDGANSREVLDALVVPGVFSHFVHPDDQMDPERARGHDWDGMVQRLGHLLGTVDRAHPWLTRRTGAEFARHVEDWWKARAVVVREADGLLLRAENPPPGGLALWVRAPRGAQVEFQGACGEAFRSPSESRYVVRVGSEACAIRWH